MDAMIGIRAWVAKVLQDIADLRISGFDDDVALRDDLHLDFLGVVELFTAAEWQFGVRIPDESVHNARTIGNVITAISMAQNRGALHHAA